MEWSRVLGICVAGMLAVVLTLKSFGQVQHFVFIWPGSGVLLGTAAPRWRHGLSERLFTVLAAMLGVGAGGLVVGMPLWLRCKLPFSQVSFFTWRACFYSQL